LPSSRLHSPHADSRTIEKTTISPGLLVAIRGSRFPLSRNSLRVFRVSRSLRILATPPAGVALTAGRA
jgi:hypothetical protein